MDGCVLLTSTPECVVSPRRVIPRAQPEGSPRGETTHTHPWLIPIITWYWQIWLLTINILLTKCKSKFESRAIPVRVAMLPRNFEDKYHSRPHPLLMKCEARAISRDPVLMRAIELRLYARLVSSAWWRRRLDQAVLFKSFISVTHRPSKRNWWIVQIYGIPMPEQVGVFFRGFARLMKVSHCSSGISLVIAMTWRTARARILNVKSPM